MFDSGVGGLTVAREVFSKLPYENIIYLGDMSRTPYGPRTIEEVQGFVIQIIHFLITKGVKLIVIACNTGTAAGLELAKKEFDIPIIGVVEPGAMGAINATQNRKVGIIATEGTINSKAYVKAIHRLDSTIEIFEKACPGFVELVENDMVKSKEAREMAEQYLQPLREAGIDSLILGCTHYPFLSHIIGEVMGPEVPLIFPAVEIAEHVRTVLSEDNLLNIKNTNPVHKFFVTGKARQFMDIGRKFFGKNLPMAKEVQL